MKNTHKPIVPAVDQAAQLLIHLEKHSGSGKTVTEICRDIGIHKSKGYSILNTLMNYDMISKNQDSKKYSLGPGLINLARNVLDNIDIKQISEPYLRELADETKSTAVLGQISGDHIFITSRKEGDESIGVTIRPGKMLHITHGAHGKAIFAFMNDAAKQRILDKGEFYFCGDGTSVNLNNLQPEFMQCRTKGFAVDAGETNPGINALSAPLFDHTGNVNGCVILIGTFTRNKFNTFGKKVTQISRRISEKSGVAPENIKI